MAYTGVVKSYNSQKGYGFIECAATQALYGKDMFVLRTSLPGQFANRGDQVTFNVKQENSGPVATEVNVISRAQGSQMMQQMVGAVDGTVYMGAIKSWNPDKGWGLILCETTQQMFGKDVFFGKSVAQNQFLSPGVPVRFTIKLEEKGPAAATLEPQQDVSSAFGYGSTAGGFGGGCGGFAGGGGYDSSYSSMYGQAGGGGYDQSALQQQGLYQQQGYQQQGYPQQTGYQQQGGYQQQTGGYQQADYQQGGYQQADYQQGGYQQGGYQQGGYQQGGYQQGGYQQGGYQQGGYQQGGYQGQDGSLLGGLYGQGSLSQLSAASAVGGLRTPSPNQTFYGVLTNFGDEKGWGHIKSEACTKVFGKDAFFLKQNLQIPGQPVQTGSLLSFQVSVGPKGPQAMSVSLLPPRSFRADGEESIRFTATVKNFDADRGLGLLEGEQLTASFGKEIAIHKADNPGQYFKDGDQVQFNVELDEAGQPVAKKVTVLQAAQAGVLASSTGGLPGATPPAAIPELRQLANGAEAAAAAGEGTPAPAQTEGQAPAEYDPVKTDTTTDRSSPY